MHLSDTIKKKWIYILVESIVAGLIILILFPNFSYLSFLLGLLGYGLFSHYTKKNNSFVLLKAFFKKLGIFPILGVSLYALWCIILLIYIKQISSGIQIIDFIIHSFGPPSEFIKSYAPSAIDSLIFFILVGITLTVHSMRQPEDEKLSRKVEHIFPTVPTESKLSQYLINKVSELACINELTERIISISEFSKEDSYIKLSIKSHSVIKNMHNNHPFSRSNMPWGFSVESAKPNESILGEIHEVSIIHNITGSSEEKHLLNGIAQLTPEAKSYKIPYSLDIKEEKEVLYQTNAWAWEHTDKKWNFNSLRYTELRKFTLINDTNTSFTITYDLTDKNGEVIPNKSDTFVLEPDSTKQICHEKLLPDENISFNFNELTGSGNGSVLAKKEKTDVFPEETNKKIVE